MIKYGAICDRRFFAWLEDNIEALLEKEPLVLSHAIQRSCELKAEIVAADEREAGRRALLNFGHTFGHAIEHCLGYGKWLHGEAVAAGMVMAAELSGIDGEEVTRLRELIERAGLPTAAPPIGAEKLLAAMGRDKKMKQAKMHFVMLRELGDAYLTSEFNAARLHDICAASS